MKKTLIWLLCACILLSGCAGLPPTPTETNPPAVTSPSTEPTQPSVPLLDQGIGVGENGKLVKKDSGVAVGVVTSVGSFKAGNL